MPGAGTPRKDYYRTHFTLGKLRPREGQEIAQGDLVRGIPTQNLGLSLSWEWEEFDLAYTALPLPCPSPPRSAFPAEHGDSLCPWLPHLAQPKEPPASGTDGPPHVGVSGPLD